MIATTDRMAATVAAIAQHEKIAEELHDMTWKLVETQGERDNLKFELDEIKAQLSTCISDLDYAKAMGWPDREARAIEELGELL
jgi:endonuclease I